jgi:hypothetical protein
MQRGTALDVTLTGTNLSEPLSLWTSFPAKVTISTDQNNGKDNAKLLVHLDVPKDAPIGFHAIRLATTRGISNLRVFCIDDLPQVMEVETNHSRAAAQPVAIPCVVVGRADPEISDYFKITVKAGQRVSFEVLGHRLGSAFDPQISLFDSHTGRELPGGYSNDAPGLQTDARLTYTFKEAGDYVLEIRDVIYRGGPDFWYRLRIGDFPCATAPVPMAAKRGNKVTVHFAGPTTEGVAPEEVQAPTDPTIGTLWIAPKGANGLLGWPVALGLSDLEEMVEEEPNNEPAKANRLPVPGAVTGRFLEKGDLDHYVFTAKKGQRLILQGETLEYYSPTLLDMVLKDAKGNQVGATNPQAAHPDDQRIDFTAPADGDYTLAVKHLTDWGGPDQVYRLTIIPYHPGFDFTLGIDRFDVPQGGTREMIIQTLARRDYAGPVEISVLGNPAITGQTVIGPGPPPPPNQPVARLPVTVKADLPMGAYPILIQGKATINGKMVIAYGSVRAVVKQELAGLEFPPRTLFHQVVLAVTEKPPFTLAAKFDQPEGIRGLPLSVTITTGRNPGFAEEITVTPVGLPPNVAFPATKIGKGQNEVKVQLTPAANAPLGKFPVRFTGKANPSNKEFEVTTSPAELVLALPFDLKVAPAVLKVEIGAKAKMKVLATRKGGYQGPIALELRNLPANVTAPKATIAMAEAATEIEVSAAANAAVGDKKDVNVLGTATAAANQQNASANFTVMVLKK